MNLRPAVFLIGAVLLAAPALRAQSADAADSLGAVEVAQAEERPALADPLEAAQLVAAHYPAALKREGISGTAKVRLVITREGTAAAARVSASSGNAELDSAALRVAERMRFRPARAGGAPIPVWVDFPVSFVAAAPDVAAPVEAEPDADSGEAAPGDSASGYESHTVETLPRLINQRAVVQALSDNYPPILAASRIEGRVSVRMRIDAHGRPDVTRVVPSGTHPESPRRP
jgi:TonB family protein